MLDLQIDRLRLTFTNAAGHEHRIASIAERAMAIVAEHVDERRKPDAPASLDWNTHTDEEAARIIARMCMEAL